MTTDKKTNLAVIDPSPTNTALLVIADLAKDKDMTPEKLDKYIEANIKILDKQAEIDFNRDRAAMQSELPVIEERHFNSHTKSWYAKVEDINEAITPTLSKYGFSVAFENDFPEGMVKTTAILLHKSGHSAKNTVLLPHDKQGAKGNINKTDLHAAGSSLTYGMRYSVTGLLNLSFRNKDGKSNSLDDDGNMGRAQCVTEEQRAEIQQLLEAYGIDIERFCTEYAQVESLADIPAVHFQKVKNAILKRGKANADPA